MKAIVLRRFQNKYSKKIYEVGDIITVSPNRFNEIEAALPGYVKPVEEEPPKEKPKKAGG